MFNTLTHLLVGGASRHPDKYPTYKEAWRRLRYAQEQREALAMARSRASLKRIELAITAGQASGLTCTGVSFYPDGRYEVLFGGTDATTQKPKKPEGSGWNV